MSWRDNVRRVVPYVPGEQPKENNIIKLNTNENPYPPAPGVREALAGFDYAELRKYPDPAVTDLVHALASRFEVGDDQVFVGVGSDDVIAMSFMTFFNSDKPIIFPDITYSFYDVWAEEFRIPYVTKALDENFHVLLEDYRGENGGVVLPNPNAPTGISEGLAFYEEIIRSNPDSVVIIDEAYVDFGAESAVPLIDKYDNLLVVQTFSKSRSLAGSRIGYAIGQPELIKCLNDVKYSFNSYTMDRITIKLGVESVLDEAYFKEQVARIIKTREWSKKRLSELGFTFGDSLANFIFAAHPDVPASYIFDELKKCGIYVRYFRKPRIDNYLRITIGTDEEMEKLMAELERIVKNA